MPKTTLLEILNFKLYVFYNNTRLQIGHEMISLGKESIRNILKIISRQYISHQISTSIIVYNSLSFVFVKWPFSSIVEN